MLGPLNGKLHIHDQLVIRFILFHTRFTTSNNVIVSFISSIAMSNKRIYLRSNTLHIKYKYGASITNIAYINILTLYTTNVNLIQI